MFQESCYFLRQHLTYYKNILNLRDNQITLDIKKLKVDTVLISLRQSNENQNYNCYTDMQQLEQQQHFLTVAQDILSNSGWYKHYVMGNIKKGNDRLESALESYECALKFRDVNVGLVMTAKADTLRELGRDEQAIGAYIKAIEADPQAADAYYGKALTFSSMGMKDSAINYYRKVLIMKPADATFYVAFANYLYKLFIVEEALENYSMASKIDPECAAAFHGKGVCLEKMGQHDLALTNLNRAIEISPDDIQIVLSRGVTYFSLSKYNEAVQDFQKVLAKQPANHEAYNNLGAVLDAMGNTDGAVDLYARAIQIQPTYAQAFNNKAIVLKKKGRYNQSLKSIESAVQLKPDDALYLCNRAMIYNIVGETKLARQDITRASLLFKKDGDHSDLSTSNAHFIKEAVQQFEQLMNRTEKVKQTTKRPEEIQPIIDTANKTLNMSLSQLLNPSPISHQMLMKILDQFNQLKKRVESLENENKIIQQQVTNHQNRLLNLEKYVEETIEPLKSKIFPQVVIEQKLLSIQTQYPSRRLYIQTLHSSLNSYFQSFRLIESGLFKVENPHEENLVKNIVKSIFSLCGSLPFVGPFADKLGQAVVAVMDYRDKVKFQETKQKMRFLMRNFFSEEQLCYQIMSSVIQLTERPRKFWQLDNAARELQNRKKQKSGIKRIIAQVKEVVVEKVVRAKEKVDEIMFKIEVERSFQPVILIAALDFSLCLEIIFSTTLKHLPSLRDIIVRQIPKCDNIPQQQTVQITISDVLIESQPPNTKSMPPPILTYLYNTKLNMYISYRGGNFQMVSNLSNATKWQCTQIQKNQFKISNGRESLVVNQQNRVSMDDAMSIWGLAKMADGSCRIQYGDGKDMKALNIKKPKKKFLICGDYKQDSVEMKLESPTDKNKDIWRFERISQKK